MTHSLARTGTAVIETTGAALKTNIVKCAEKKNMEIGDSLSSL